MRTTSCGGRDLEHDRKDHERGSTRPVVERERKRNDCEDGRWGAGGLPTCRHISKKHFRPGRMAASELTCSVRAVRETLVADYSARGVNATRRIAYRTLIAVSPFLLALSVSNFKQTLRLWGQL
jgi:hypothetical protein